MTGCMGVLHPVFLTFLQLFHQHWACLLLESGALEESCVWSLERGVNCTVESGPGRIRSGRICTLACLILSRKKAITDDIKSHSRPFWSALGQGFRSFELILLLCPLFHCDLTYVLTVPQTGWVWETFFKTVSEILQTQISPHSI